jgi:hypothetical protein
MPDQTFRKIALAEDIKRHGTRGRNLRHVVKAVVSSFRQGQAQPHRLPKKSALTWSAASAATPNWGKDRGFSSTAQLVEAPGFSPAKIELHQKRL